MQQVFYIHGGESFRDQAAFLEHLRTCTLRYPHGDKPQLWGSRLREDLSDFEVFAPEMPNKQNATYAEWQIWFERHFEYLTDGLILVGWSQGAFFLQKYLLENTVPFSIKALFLVAPPVQPDDLSGEDGGDFVFDTSQLGRLAKRAGQIHVLHSTDDFVVPYAHAEMLQAALPSATLHTFTDRDHFLQSEFPELVELIKKVA